MFKPAQKQSARARIAITGPSGSGKTFTALEIATGLANGGKIAVIDTERHSASIYADIFTFDTAVLDPPFLTTKYKEALKVAAQEKYAVVIVDSLTHAWKGEGGVLDQVDDEKRRQRGGNEWAAWKTGDKAWRSLLDAFLASPMHVIVTMRSKTEYVQEKDSNGKTRIRKVGMAPEAREGVEYEFTIVMDIDHDHHAHISKSRVNEFVDLVIEKPDRTVGESLLAWLNAGKKEEAQPEFATATPSAPQPPKVKAPFLPVNDETLKLIYDRVAARHEKDQEWHFETWLHSITDKRDPSDLDQREGERILSQLSTEGNVVTLPGPEWEDIQDFKTLSHKLSSERQKKLKAWMTGEFKKDDFSKLSHSDAMKVLDFLREAVAIPQPQR